MSTTTSIPLPSCASPGPVPAPADRAIENDGWWPDQSLNAFRSAMRVDAAVTDDRLADMVANAMLWANGELLVWRAAREIEGRASLADVPSSPIAGGSRLAFLYRRAVFAAVKAEADESYRQPDTKYVGDVRGDALLPTIGAYQRNAAWAIRDFLGAPRVTIELI